MKCIHQFMMMHPPLYKHMSENDQQKDPMPNNSLRKCLCSTFYLQLLSLTL